MLFRSPGFARRLRAVLPRAVDRGLTTLGRWSLTTYLVHQPILIGLLWLAT